VRTTACLVLATTLALLTTACEDDETIVNTVYDNDSTKVLALGEVCLLPYVDFSINLLHVYAQPERVDSVKFADSLCDLEDAGYYADANRVNYIASYSNMADSLRLGSGDVVTIEIFQDDSATTVELPLLASPGDSVVFDLDAIDTVISLGQPLRVFWQPVVGADWYGLMIYNYFDSLGSLAYNAWYYSTVQSACTLPASDHPHSSDYYIRIVAVAGPIPNSGVENIDGPDISGTIHCVTRSTILSARVGQGSGHETASPAVLSYEGGVR